jgi:hypothetical protein
MAGEAFSPGVGKSGDYSLQLIAGYKRYTDWRKDTRGTAAALFARTRMVLGSDKSFGDEGISEVDRQGPAPITKYDQPDDEGKN